MELELEDLSDRFDMSTRKDRLQSSLTKCCVVKTTYLNTLERSKRPGVAYLRFGSQSAENTSDRHDRSQTPPTFYFHC